MLNIETAALPDPAIVELQPSADGPNLPGIEKALFDVALQEETEKALALATVDSLVNAEGLATMALVPAAPAVGVAPAPANDTPDAIPSTEEPERVPNPHFLGPLPFLALFAEPNRQILPSMGTSAAPQTPLEPEPNVTPLFVDPSTTPIPGTTSSPAPVSMPVAAFIPTPTAPPTRAPLPAMFETPQPEPEIESGSTKPVLQDWVRVANSQQAVPRQETEVSAKLPDVTSEQQREIEKQVLPRTDSEIGTRQESPDAPIREAAPVGASVFTMEEDRPADASEPAEVVHMENKNEKAQPEQSRVVRRQSRGKAREESHATEKVSPERTVLGKEIDLRDVVASRAPELKVPATATAGNASSAKSQDEASPAPEVLRASDQPRIESSEPSVVRGTDTSQQDARNPDERRASPDDLEIEVGVRPIRKENDNHTVRATVEARPESRHSEIQPDLRSGGMAHEIKGRTPESIKVADAPAVSPFEQWDQIEKSSVLTQLVEKARSLRWDRNSEIVVSLKPESLGKISMRASLVDRTMVATIAAESEKVRQLIQVELPVLQRTLQEGGIPAKVVVSDQSDVALNYNSANHGQPRFRQDTPMLSDRNDLIALGPASTPEVADSRYSSHSVHLIA